MTLGGGGEGQRQTKEKEGRLAGRLGVYLSIYVFGKTNQQSLSSLRLRLLRSLTFFQYFMHYG